MGTMRSEAGPSDPHQHCSSPPLGTLALPSPGREQEVGSHLTIAAGTASWEHRMSTPTQGTTFEVPVALLREI